MGTKWKQFKLDEIVDILDNRRIPVSSEIRAKRIGDIPYYGATGQTGTIDDFIFDEELVLVGEDGAPFFDIKKNVAYIINGKSWVNNHAHVLRAKDTRTNNRFVFYFLNQFNFNGFVSGTTRLKLNQSSLKSIPISLPPLPEQERIVAKLDSIFSHLETAKQGLEKIPVLLKEFRQAVLTQAVTGKLTEEWRVGKDLNEWKNLEVGQICESIVPGRDKPKSFSGDIPWITTPCLTHQYIDSKNAELFLSDEEIKQVRAKKIPVNSVVISIVGRFGLACIVKEECVINQQLHAYLPSKKILPEFLMYSIQTKENYMMSISSSTTIAYINKTKANSIPIHLPPLGEQTEIVRRVEALFSKADAIEAQYKKLKKQIDQLPQAVLAKAFRGEM